ncbi:MAG: L,D-transpeptidase family protein, partial [Phycisphaerales bacterium]|nr:L,D-transpeptidase family protein [Phycisphaerales bacterium]
APPVVADTTTRNVDKTDAPRTTSSSNAASRMLANAFELARTDPVAARRELTSAWTAGGLSPTERIEAANLAQVLSDIVLFDPRMINNDPFTRRYTVKSGDALERIVRKEGIEADWMFLSRINKLRNANAIHPGQTLKVPVGTFHAIVDKDEYRMDLYQDNGTDRVLVTAFNVGLGEFDGTPVGLFKVRPASKLVNPVWIDPRTHKEYDANDPANPIGEHWIGIRGEEAHNRDLDGFGIHGTIEPNSIGQQQSMGCIRMLPEDVALIYEVLTEPNSTVNIVQANRIAVESTEE